jgi:uncharacterized damage-inducible protein DinB
MTPVDPQFLVTLLGQAYDRKSWHGPTLKGALRGVTTGQAAWRPAKGRHDIHEIALHAAYWKYIVRRRLSGEGRGSFPLRGSNWFPRPVAGTAAEWAESLKLLDAAHRALVEEVSRFPAQRLEEVPRGSRVSNLAMITGAATHDLYHAGQVQLIKRLRTR